MRRGNGIADQHRAPESLHRAPGHNRPPRTVAHQHLKTVAHSRTRNLNLSAEKIKTGPLKAKPEVKEKTDQPRSRRELELLATGPGPIGTPTESHRINRAAKTTIAAASHQNNGSPPVPQPILLHSR